MVLLKRIKEFKRTGDTRYIYRNQLDKACFQHDSAYADHKDLINRTKADKVLKRIILLVIQNMVVIKAVQRVWFISFLIKSQ